MADPHADYNPEVQHGTQPEGVDPEVQHGRQPSPPQGVDENGEPVEHSTFPPDADDAPAEGEDDAADDDADPHTD